MMSQHVLDVFKTLLMKVKSAADFGNKDLSVIPSDDDNKNLLEDDILEDKDDKNLKI